MAIMQFSIAFLPAIAQFSKYGILSVTGNHISIGVASNKLLLRYLLTAHQNTTLTSVYELACCQGYHTICCKIAMHFNISYSDANDLRVHDCKINLCSLDWITLLVNIRQHYFYCFFYCSSKDIIVLKVLYLIPYFSSMVTGSCRKMSIDCSIKRVFSLF